MSADGGYAVILFDSVTQCMWAEKLITKTSIPYKLIPVPKNISADCGICLRVALADAAAAEATLRGVVEYRGVATIPGRE